MNKLYWGIVAVLLNVSVVYADQAIESRLDAFLVVLDSKGQEQLEKANEAEPGQILEYRLAYSNNSEETFQKLVINGLVPANTEYIANSSRSDVDHGLLVSIDQGKTFQPEPVKRKSQQQDGSVKEEVVPVSEYTNLRWKSQAALQPGKTQEFFYRVRVK